MTRKPPHPGTNPSSPNNLRIQRLQATLTVARAADILDQLSEKERQVLELGAAGHYRPAIGQALGITTERAGQIEEHAVKRARRLSANTPAGFHTYERFG